MTDMEWRMLMFPKGEEVIRKKTTVPKWHQ